MIELDADLPPALVPLAWLLGRWEGAGVVGYPTMESANFGQEVVVSHDGRPFLEWHSHSWLLDEAGRQVKPLASELGFWRPQEGGEVELLLAHNTGIVEMYFGTVEPARIELRTDTVLRSADSAAYTAGQRLYGLVDGDLLWAMDMATATQPMTSHASAQLKRVA